MSLEPVPMFSGDPVGPESTQVTPSTFLKKFRSRMMGIIGNATMTADEKDEMKIAAFQDFLEEDSPADKWFAKLQTPGATTVVTTWAALEAAFKARFPNPEKAERTEQEWERELSKMRITLEELDTTVKVGGADVYTHVYFAGRQLEMAELAGIGATSSGIWQARDALPEPLREKVPASQASWKTYTAAIKAVDRVGLRESVAKARKTQNLERTVADLGRRGAPSAPLTPVSKMAGQLARTALTTPRAPAPARGGAPANPFGGGGGQGNLFTPPEALTEAGKVHLRGIITTLSRSMLQDDAAGRGEYERRLSGWQRVHGNSRVLLEQTGYPLSPGTVPPCSRECYVCGKVTVPWHRRNDCPGPPIPQKESTFRALCAKYLPVRAVPVNAVFDDLSWMDFGEDTAEEGFGEGLSE